MANATLNLIDDQAIETALLDICDRYETTAPTVWAWADDLYIRFNEDRDSVRISEVTTAAYILSDGGLDANLAANVVYKLMHRLGQDTKGHLGF